MAYQTLDTRGLSCPMPILRARKALSSMGDGQRVEVLSTDPASIADFEAFCRTTGNLLLEKSENGETYRYLIERKG